MRRRSTASKPVKRRGHHASGQKPRKALTRRASAADLQQQLDRRTHERDEALEQQAATSEVLKVISRSASDLSAALDTLLATACRLCHADIGTIRFEEGDHYRLAATFGCPPEYRKHFAGYTSKPDLTSVFGQTIIRGRTVHIPDVLLDPDYARPNAQKLTNLRAALGVPLVREGRVFGAVNLFRTMPRSFTPKQIALVETFTDQAVIAIENARLFEAEQQRGRELSESVEQQTATSEVLKVISSSPGELKPVFRAMLEKAVNICDAKFGLLFRWEGDGFRTVAMHDLPQALADERRLNPVLRPNPQTGLGRLVETKRTIQVEDVRVDPGYQADPVRRAGIIGAGGARTLIAVPMLKDNELVGAISIYRQEVRPFTDKQTELVQNFAAQAVIAIENTRLLNELRESLEQQTGTAEVLRVISSSPGDLHPVFQTMLENAVRICEAKFGTLFRFDGEWFHLAAQFGTPPEYAEFQRRRGPFLPSEGSINHRVFQTKRVAHCVDYATEPNPGIAVTLGGARSTIAVPLLKDSQLIGSIIIYRREVRPFSDKQIALLENFAAQAVIAIENARLLNELRESLQQQTATADVLRIISSSPGELEPVFQAILENATRLCTAKFGILHLREGDAFRTTATFNLPLAFAETRKRGDLLRPSPLSMLGRLVSLKRMIHLPDVTADQAYIDRDPFVVTAVELGGRNKFMN
jgi:GAF domain-containing protein